MKCSVLRYMYEYPIKISEAKCKLTGPDLCYGCVQCVYPIYRKFVYPNIACQVYKRYMGFSRPILVLALLSSYFIFKSSQELWNFLKTHKLLKKKKGLPNPCFWLLSKMVFLKLSSLHFIKMINK